MDVRCEDKALQYMREELMQKKSGEKKVGVNRQRYGQQQMMNKNDVVSS